MGKLFGVDLSGRLQEAVAGKTRIKYMLKYAIIDSFVCTSRHRRFIILKNKKKQKILFVNKAVNVKL